MQKLIFYELKKLFSSRVMLVLMAVLLIVNGYFVWRVPTENQIKAENELDDFIEIYEAEPAEMEAYMENYITLYRASSSDRTLPRPESVYSEHDMTLFSNFAKIRDINETYAEVLARAKTAAKSKLVEYDYFGYTKNSFEVVYQTSVLESYSALDSLTFPMENVIGYDVYFTYNGFCVFLLLAISLCGIMLVTNEKNAGMLMILRSTRRGRVETFLAKLIAGFIVTAVLCVLFSVSTLGVISARMGLHGWDLPLQMVEAMQLAPHAISIGEGVLFTILVRIFSAFVFMVIIVMIASLLNGYLAIFGTTFVFIGINYVVANYQFLDGYSFLRNINFFWCIDGLRILEEWRGVKLFGKCIALLPTWLIVYGVLAVAVGILGCYSYSHGISVGKAGKKIAIKLPKFIRIKKRFHTSLYRFELKKMVTLFTVFVFAASVALTVYLASDAYILKKDYTQNFYSQYMSEIEGPWTEEKHAKIETEARELAAIRGQKDSMLLKYQSGEITQTEYNQYLGKLLDAQKLEQAYERLTARSEYLKEMHEAGFSVAYFDDSGWNKLLSVNISWLACIAIILLCADLFSMEYRTGFWRIQSLTKNGRMPVTVTKFLLAVTIAAILGVVSEVTQYISADIGFALIGGGYAAASIEGLTGNLPIWLYFTFATLKNVLLCILLACAVAGISRLTKKLIPTLIGTTTVVFAPMVFSYFGIEIFEKISFINLFMR